MPKTRPVFVQISPLSSNLSLPGPSWLGLVSSFSSLEGRLRDFREDSSEPPLVVIRSLRYSSPRHPSVELSSSLTAEYLDRTYSSNPIHHRWNCTNCIPYLHASVPLRRPSLSQRKVSKMSYMRRWSVGKIEEKEGAMSSRWLLPTGLDLGSGERLREAASSCSWYQSAKYHILPRVPSSSIV